MARIILENITFHARIGHLAVEHKVGNSIRVDVAFDTETTQPETTDELGDTVDYKAVFDTLRIESRKPSKLIENMARRMLDALVKNFPEACNWELRLAKKNPPVNGQMEQVSVVLRN